MKAAILEQIGAPLVVDDIGLPELGVGQALIRVYVSGICGAQVGEIAGARGPDKHLPHLLGHEGGGIVEDVGVGVQYVKRGDRVVIHWRKGKGIESQCPKYAWRDRTVGGGRNTTFQEYSIISENRLTVILEDTSFDIAALMGCAITTAFGLINNEAQLKIGQSIAVIGCGGVGLNVIQGAALAGAYRIMAVDVHPQKLIMAMGFGADEFTNPDGMENMRGFDVVVDTTGLPEMISKAYKIVAPDGKIIMVGQMRGDEALVIPNMRQNFRGVTLMDSCGGRTNPNEDIPRYLALYESGRLKLDELITHRFPLEQVNEALDVVRSGQAGRVILEMK